MRTLITKYEGACRKCGTTIPAGAQAVYERRVGIFCPPCAPTDPEEIRALRTDAAEAKAARLDGWAAKREEKAAAVLDVPRSHYSRDWAFVTQPGHIPARARWIERQDREIESLRTAQDMRERAERLRNGVRVKGDREAEREGERAKVRAWIEKGMSVDTCHFGVGIVERVNQKTATVRVGTWKTAVPLHFLTPTPETFERIKASRSSLPAPAASEAGR